MNLTERPIGVFDSGMGGLTVLAELVKRLPNEEFIYLGDTARVPYGSRSPRTVQRYSVEVASYLLKQDIKLLVIACNTATSHAGALLEQTLPVPVLGVIEPGVDALLSVTKNRRVGVIGTRSTIKSGSYQSLIQKRDSQVLVFGKECPLFVPIVEEGWIDKRITSLVIDEYLSEMVREEVDTIVLGCTHYPLLKKSIQSVFPNLNLVDSSIEMARAVEKKLEESNLKRTSQKSSSNANGVKIFLTDLTDQMKSLEQLFYGLPFQSVEEVEILEEG